MIESRTAIALAASAMLAGCAMSVPIGRPYPQLPGTEWRVIAVNGQPTPASGDYLMRFEGPRNLTARFGCNHMGGRYQSLGGTVTVTNLNQTLMGCPESASTFESRASAILTQRMKADISDGGRLVLSNTLGSITLVRMR